MAELRWEVMHDSVPDATTTANAAQEFRNETSRILHIRRLRWAHKYGAAGPNEGGVTELSKAPVLQSATDESPFFTLPVRVEMGSDVALDSSHGENGESLYGRGHLTLEPNESLFNNATKTSGGVFVSLWVIAYEF